MAPASAAIPAPTNARDARKKNSSPSPRHRDLTKNPVASAATSRPPLFPSEKDNNTAAPRRHRGKEITSRYLSSSSSSSSSAKGGSFSSSAARSSSKASSFNSSSSSSFSTPPSSSASVSSLRRFPSPLRLATPPALSQPSAVKRSKSADRTRPTAATPRVAELSSAARTLCNSATTTRSLSVSFQGESFSYQTTRARALSPSPAARKQTPTPERRKPFAPAANPPRSSVDGLENSRPLEKRHRWPAARLQQSNPLTRSLDYSIGKKDSVLEAVRSLRKSMMLEGGMRRASFDGGDLPVSSDTDSLSSSSNSGSHEYGNLPLKGQSTPRGISIPARFLQEKSNTSPRLLESPAFSSSPCLKTVTSSKLAKVKKSLSSISLLSPFTSSSSQHSFARPSSPNQLAYNSLMRTPSPQTMRNGWLSTSTAATTRNASSVPNFTTEMKRARNCDNQIEGAHKLRLFYNRHLQWRWVNAQANDALLVQNLTVEQYLYDACIGTVGMHESITYKKLKLQVERQHLKLYSILKGQMGHLEEWALLGRDHTNYLKGAIEALRANTICLPVVDGAKADFQEVRNAVGSAVDVMQAIATTICSMLSEIVRRGSMAAELLQLTTKEQTLILHCRDLLTTIAAMNVKHCSLLGYLTQQSAS